ncbi:MAG: FAD-dependent oxidoreductase, partial [Pseudomonadota bacterium]
MDKRRVVILGGGFAGLEAAKALRSTDAEVVLIDRRNYHLFQPLLYQVATAGLSPASIAAPIRYILSNQKNTSVIMGEVKSINLRESRIDVEGETLSYDY